MVPRPVQLSSLVDMDNPRALLREVTSLAREVHPGIRMEKFNALFRDILRLFSGGYPGFRKCNTDYHDLRHTTDNLLALMRLIHGADRAGIRISEKGVLLGLTAALLHDVGYIQERGDLSGTGAKHTKAHVRRSIEFAGNYLAKKGFTEKELLSVTRIIECTDASRPVSSLAFPSREIELIGKMQGTADLLGQMADRTYLEKLLLLYLELTEGEVPGYASEFDLLKKTLRFRELALQRFDRELGGVRKYLRFHFRKRHHIDRDLYAVTIENNMSYLKGLVARHPKDYRKFLRRGGIVKKLVQKERRARRKGPPC